VETLARERRGVLARERFELVWARLRELAAGELDAARGVVNL
jgi:hypothetical protein